MASRAPIDRRIFQLALLAGLPAVVAAESLAFARDWTLHTQLSLSAVVLLTWLGAAFAARARVTRPLQTLSNLVAAIREGDYSVRARHATRTDPLGEVLVELNALSGELKSQRLGELEAAALLRTVMAEIDVAVFAFDDTGVLRLANRAGERLLGTGHQAPVGSAAEALGMSELLVGEAPRRVDATHFAEVGPWELRRNTFRQDGRPHTLVVLAQLRRALREEERLAWQRLVRVLSHEINNSLAPIHSISASLLSLLEQQPRPSDWDEDARRGLDVISRRSEALGRFMAAYARLARLPPPAQREVELGPLVRRAVALESRLPIAVEPGPELVLRADPDQLEQLLINLIRNAVDAALETSGGVRVRWRSAEGEVEVRVEDEGPGLPPSANLFVPFFTTKPQGSGIGLVLSREIAEGHGGTLRLQNAQGHRGCEAVLRLPR